MTKKHIKRIVLAMIQEGLDGSDLDTAVSRFIMESCGIEHACPMKTHFYAGGLIKHNLNYASEERQFVTKAYWRQYANNLTGSNNI